MKRPLSVLFLFSALLPLSGCYLLKQGTYLVGHNARARSIERVLAERLVDQEVEQMLLDVQEIRRYAVESIGLEANRNYTRYLELDREYVVDVVTACRADSFTPHTWRFPFFGAFPYKGFYEQEDAEREAARLQKRGLDVWIRRVEAFSTLGFFSDPIYSFMSDYSAFSLADLIIHEQTHATIFVKNQVQFNEELANFVGREGALAYLRERYGEHSQPYQQALASLADWSVFRDRALALYRELDDLYGRETDRETLLLQKRRTVERFNERLRGQAGQLFQTEGFRGFQGIPVNNAYIMSFVRYNRDLDLFYTLYEKMGRDLPATVEVLKQLDGTREPPKDALRRLISDPGRQ